jgi:hypothetical protein
MVMINTTEEILYLDLDGNPISEGRDQNLTLGRGISAALMNARQVSQALAQIGQPGPRVQWNEVEP